MLGNEVQRPLHLLCPGWLALTLSCSAFFLTNKLPSTCAALLRSGLGWFCGHTPLPLLHLLGTSTSVSTVHPYLLASQVPVPASSRHIISSAAGTGMFCCQLEAEILKNKTWPILSIICFHQNSDLHSGTTHTITRAPLSALRMRIVLVAGCIFTCLFQMQLPASENLGCLWLVEDLVYQDSTWSYWIY